jgi:hypothetical protein
MEVQQPSKNSCRYANFVTQCHTLGFNWDVEMVSTLGNCITLLSPLEDPEGEILV